MKAAVLSVAVGVVVVLWLVLMVEIARGDHQVRLPGIPDTPAVRNIWSDGELTWCLDSRASKYPGFRSQVIQTLNDSYDRIGVRHREVSFGGVFETGCEVQHRMPDNFSCNGCAANVAYANWSVVVQYKYQLGYSDWKSAIGHEMGHVYGLHEQYIDSGGSINCGNPKTVSVMDCGAPQLWQLQPFDIDNLKGWLYPPYIGERGLAQHEGRWFAWWCGGDPNPSRSTLTAVMYLDPNGAFYWSGLSYGVAYPACQNHETWVYCIPGRLIYLNQQMAGWPDASWDPSLRNDALLGVCP